MYVIWVVYGFVVDFLTVLVDINNVGSMSQALYAHQHPVYDEVEAASWQAAQVSAISLMNFSGRIFIGKKQRIFFAEKF